MFRTTLAATTLAAALTATTGLAQPKSPAFDAKPRVSLKGHTNQVHAVAFAADGRTVATASKDKTVRIWDAATGERKERIAHQGEAHCLAFTADGKRLVVGGYEPTVTVYATADGEKVGGFKVDGSVARLAVAPDGKRVATVYVGRFADTDANSFAAVWDLASGKPVCQLKGHTGTIHDLLYDPAGKRIATVSSDSTIRIWDAGTGAELDSLKAHDGAVNAACFSADGKVLVTAGSDGTVVRWGLKSGNVIKPVLEKSAEENGHVVAVALLPSGRVWGHTLGGGNVVWAAETGKVVGRSPSGTGFIGASNVRDRNQLVVASPDGKSFAVVSRNDVTIYDASAAFGADEAADDERVR